MYGISVLAIAIARTDTIALPIAFRTAESDPVSVENKIVVDVFSTSAAVHDVVISILITIAIAIVIVIAIARRCDWFCSYFSC